jgi:hypothetical protein
MNKRQIPLAFLFLAIVSCSGDDAVTPGPQPARQFDITFIVTVPANTPAADSVFVVGDFQGWDPGDPAYALAQRPDDRWEILLTLPEGKPIEFKFTRGTWASIEKGPGGAEMPNRTASPVDGEVHELVVVFWADLGG